MAGDRCEFVCDAMLGGLARWLRAAGYDAEFDPGIEDRRLVARARATQGVLLSSDAGIFERNIIRDGTVRALFVPRGLGKLEQLAFVMRELALPVRPQPRCMACGGELLGVDRRSVRDLAPPKTYAVCREFWRCARCGKLLWRGAHWKRITAGLADMQARTGRQVKANGG